MKILITHSKAQRIDHVIVGSFRAAASTESKAALPFESLARLTITCYQ